MTKTEEKIADLNTGIEVINRTLETHGKNHDLTNDQINRLRDENAALRERIAKLEQIVAELKAVSDRWRQWALGLAAGFLVTLVSGVVGLYFNYLKR